MAAGSNGLILLSEDGVTWTGERLRSTDFLNGIAYGNQTFVAVGSGGSFSSRDGNVWSSNDESASPLIDIAFGDGRFIATTVNSIGVLVSTNGVEWHSEVLDSLPYNTSLWGIAHMADRFIAVGNGGVVQKPASNWVGHLRPSEGVFRLDACTGQNSSYSIQVSSDLLNWNDQWKVTNSTGKVQFEETLAPGTTKRFLSTAGLIALKAFSISAIQAGARARSAHWGIISVLGALNSVKSALDQT